MTTNPQPARYRRTSEADAVQWTGRNEIEMAALCSPFDFQTIEPEDRTEDPDETAAVRTHPHGGWLGLKPGDWVLKCAGHYTTASDEEFRAEWEPSVPASAPADRAAVYAEVADRLAADAEQGDKDGLTRIYRRSAAAQVRGWADELRRAAAVSGSGRVADETQADGEAGCAHCGGPHAWDDCAAYTALVASEQPPETQADDVMFGSEGCTCKPWTVEDGQPRYLEPHETVDKVSGWARRPDCPHHQPAEDPS